MAGAALTSGYLVVYVVTALGSALLARGAGPRERPRRRGVLLRLSAAAAATLAVLYVVLHPYLELQGARGASVDAGSIGGALLSYLKTAADLHYELWSHALWPHAPRALFPGAAALVLAGGALLARRSAPRGVRRMLLAVAGAGLLLSLGSLTPVYEWFSVLVPPVQSLRAPSRFGTLAVFAVGALAGLGLAAFRRAVPPRWGVAGAVGLLAVATAESLHAPLPYRPVDWSPPIHRALARSSPDRWWSSRCTSAGNSTATRGTCWRRRTTGGRWWPASATPGPASSTTSRASPRPFPSVLAVARLEALGVTHVVVHVSRYPRSSGIRADLDDLGGRSDVVPVAEVGPDRLYRIREAAAGGGRHGLGELPWSELRVVAGPGDGSYLRGYEAGYAFGLQGAGALRRLSRAHGGQFAPAPAPAGADDGPLPRRVDRPRSGPGRRSRRRRR